MRRIPIGLTERQHERLRRRAAERHVSVATLVREAVDRTYPDEDDRRREARHRAREVFGAFASGRSDISERHDDYLGELDRW